MRAAILKGKESIEVEDVATPSIKDHSILVKVKSCAICGSDLRILEHGHERVKYPAIIGHEISGKIVEIGDGVNNFKKGDRITLGADVPCGICEHCINGIGNCCHANYAIGYQFPGGFAEYCLLEPMVVKYGPISKIPENISYDEASLAEPLACCINGMELAKMSIGKSVLVIGAGPVGCMMVMLSRVMGSPNVILAEKDSKRLSMAMGFNADYCINNSIEDLHKRIMEITKGRGVDVAIVACPSIEAQEEAVKVVAKRGVVNLFGGLPRNSRDLSISSNLIHYKECYIVGAHGSVPRQHKIAAELIGSGRVDVKGLISHKFRLEDIKEGFSIMKTKNCLKVIIKP
jgi:L-iditol 2-dehydrogenase